ncbi:hypothetical protein RFI_34347 [Reticulomyxa filosa]|uniref:Uncharacterized protein n=1 Tax=Reticulomyxa filosa TaxID=46433 RepID=X6LPJ2_RETFI|nr:hypothetical protein RFI_34347 [Reticulomyxa filosa]|eukprot:ETO03062.1 hypothetical protein RFI_34347 [Reticulomyxa filosa]
MVPYKHTIGIERNSLPKSGPFQDNIISLKKINLIHYLQVKLTRNNYLQKLLHELIKNGYLNDLISKKILSTGKDVVKQQMNYNEQNSNELILNDLILIILNELKILYHDDIHKQMGYTLQLWDICAILLYCGKSCNVQFSYDQIKFRHHNWHYLDFNLYNAIDILHLHERREKSEMELYCD